MAAGRPKKEISILPENWDIDILALYTEGASDVEAKAYLYNTLGTFSNSLWDRWLKDEPQFSQTIKKGKQLSAAWWEQKGRINLENSKFNYTGWYMNMKNRFNWADKSETKVTGDINVTPLTFFKTDDKDK